MGVAQSIIRFLERWLAKTEENKNERNNHVRRKNKFDLRVPAEIASIQTNAKGERLVTDKILGETAIETCMVLLLDHAAHHAPIADPRMVKLLTGDHYNDIHTTKGGLSWETYTKYACGCSTLLEAAERHRAFIAGLKK